jgi:hypothetical protein
MNTDRRDELLKYMSTPVPFEDLPLQFREKGITPKREIFKTEGGWMITYWRSLPEYPLFATGLIEALAAEGILAQVRDDINLYELKWPQP